MVSHNLPDLHLEDPPSKEFAAQVGAGAAVVVILVVMIVSVIGVVDGHVWVTVLVDPGPNEVAWKDSMVVCCAQCQRAK